MKVKNSLLVFADGAVLASLIANVVREGEEEVGGTVIRLTTGQELHVEESMNTVVAGWVEALDNIDDQKFELAEAARCAWPSELKVQFPPRNSGMSFTAQIIP